MKQFLKRLSYYTNNQRTFDYLLFYMRKVLTGELVFTAVVFVLTLVGILFRIRIPDLLYAFIFLLLFINVMVSLYIGVWHTRLTSRQRFKLFEKRGDFKRVDRIKTIKLYIAISFANAILSSVAIIILTINNYILATVNTMYLNADSYIKYGQNVVPYKTLHLLIGKQFTTDLMLVFPVFIFIYLFVNSFQKDIKPYRVLVEQWIASRFFKDPAIDHLVQDKETKGLADVRIGKDSKYGYEIIMSAATRTLNSVWLGLIGTGKSASIAKPIIINDSSNIVYYLRKYADFVRKSKAKVAAMHLSEKEAERELDEELARWIQEGIGKDLTNGFYVNEPSGDLIRDALYIVERTGLPEEMVWLVDPSRTDTDAINVLDTNTTQAAALTSDLFRNFSEGKGGGNNTFFLNSEETHTRNIVNLVKETAYVVDAPINENLNGKAPTLNEFYELLRNNNFIFARLRVLEIVAKREERLFSKIDHDYKAHFEKEYNNWCQNGNDSWDFDNNMSKALKDEHNYWRDRRNKLEVMKGTIDYFKQNADIDNNGNVYFKFEANIRGLQNVIERLASNIETRRVFFSQSTKNVDALLEMGGIMLVNSASAELGDSNSRLVGQMAEIIMQSGAYRRVPNKSPIFPFMNDEKNTILMPRDGSFLDQNRKFRTPVIHLYQNYEQAEKSIGADGAKALFQSYRNTFTFQQASPETVDYISRRAGNKIVLEESNRYADDDLLAGNDSNSVNVSETFVEKEFLTKTTVKGLEKMEFAGVMVENDEVSDVLYITSFPNYELPIFRDKEKYKPDFDVKHNPTDKEIFDIWKEQVKRYYKKHEKDVNLREEDFTEEEWLEILKVQTPTLDDDSKLPEAEELGEKPTLSKEKKKQAKREEEAQSALSDSEDDFPIEVVDDVEEAVEEEHDVPSSDIQSQSEIEDQNEAEEVENSSRTDFYVANEKEGTISQNKDIITSDITAHSHEIDDDELY